MWLNIFSFLFLFFSLRSVVAQPDTTTSLKFTRTQTLKGKITDKQSKYPIIGATVEIINTNPSKGTVSNETGDYKIDKVPLGRYIVKISYLGYSEITIPNILLTSGKEYILNIEMEEEVNVSEEIVVVGEKDKSKANNDMATVSARSFTIEETSRYAGSRNDPARMAMNFAGVNGTSDARNDIIIRGNSPLGVLWRLEGVDIPSPNHFGSFGTTGGPVGMLNNNVLSNSDFMTSAFPASYGNAISGVFDLRMRKGNNEKREHLIQFGFNGLEFGTEGPISRKSKSSYLINYRYSTLEIFKAIGINFGTSSLPEYQDLTFKLDFPLKGNNKISLFAIGGLSGVSVNGNNTDTTDLYTDRGYNAIFKSRMGATGISYHHFFNPTTSSKISFAVSNTQTLIEQDSIPQDMEGNFIGPALPQYRNTFGQTKITLSQNLIKKFTAKNTLTMGYILNQYYFKLIDSVVVVPPVFKALRNFKGNNLFLQTYANWQHRFTQSLSFNAGLHFQYFLFNKTYSVEPRLGVKYQLTNSQSINFGYGLHSQLQPFQAYFRLYQDPLQKLSLRTNENLEFVKSHQWVLGYDHSLTKDLRIKAETYYQYIYNAAVERKPTSFSMLNSGADFEIYTRDSMVNDGNGKNYGLELTLEKFYSKGYYFLITASLYHSQYKGSDGIWRNTAFNGNRIFNVLAGKEFILSPKATLIYDIKVTWSGGRRFTPLNEELSKAMRRQVYDETRAYEGQFRDYFRPDMKLTLRLNGKKMTHEVSLDVQNIINRKNPFIQKYNSQKNRIIVTNQLGLFPVLQYRVTF